MSVRVVWKANAAYDEFRRERVLEGTIARTSHGDPVLIHKDVPYVFTDIAPNTVVTVEITGDIDGELMCLLLDAREAGFIMALSKDGEPYCLPLIRIAR